MVGCGESASPVGYWEGSGRAREVPMDDAVRHLTRSAEFQFWFTLDEEGNAVGEIELDYDAKLTVKNIPQMTVPIPGGSITFAPEVGGQLTDLDPRRRFAIVGVLSDNNELTLKIALEESDRQPLDFTIRSDVGISAGIVGSAGVGGAQYRERIRKIDMVPFSPFNGSAAVEVPADGVYAAHFEEKGENYAIEWSTHKVRDGNSDFKMKAELEIALQELRISLSEHKPDDRKPSQGGAEKAVRLAATLSPEFQAGDIISLHRITGGEVAEPGPDCTKRHLKVAPGKSGITIDSEGPFPEPDIKCRYGEIVP